MEHIKELVSRFWKQAKELGFITNEPEPLSRFDLRGAVASQAYTGLIFYGNLQPKYHLRFNLPLLSRVSDEELRQTVGHEVVHIVQTLHDGYCDKHGPRWKATMVAFGLEPRRCHNYDTTGLVRKQKRLDIQCACGVQYALSKTIVNKIKRGQLRVCYKCKRKVTI